MTDRHAGYLVTLADDIREDQAEHILTALRMISGVLAVEPMAADHRLLVATQRVNAEWRQRINGLLEEHR